MALAEEGHALPGEVLFGTDSHTCNAGAFGEFASGVGNTDAAFILGTGQLLIKVPPTIRFNLEGEMPGKYLLVLVHQNQRTLFGLGSLKKEKILEEE